MKLTALDIPDDDTQLALWLEQQVVGMELVDLVAQLIVARKSSSAATLDEVLGSRLQNVLDFGFNKLSPDQLRSLLDQPQLLLELQEQVFVAGGDYWQTVPITFQHQQTHERVLSSVSSEIEKSVTQKELAPTVSIPISRWFVPLAVAAALLVAFGIWDSRPADGPTWGFDRPGMFAEVETARDYLTLLADASGDWFNKAPESSEALKKRLEDFRHGCDTLLAASHSQLDEDDKTWLLDRCRVWRDGIDNRLKELSVGKLELAVVRKRADTLIKQMSEELQVRAEQLG